MYLSMVVFEECLAEYHPRMTGHSDLIKIKFMGVQEAMEGQEYTKTLSELGARIAEMETPTDAQGQ